MRSNFESSLKIVDGAVRARGRLNWEGGESESLVSVSISQKQNKVAGMATSPTSSRSRRRCGRSTSTPAIRAAATRVSSSRVRQTPSASSARWETRSASSCGARRSSWRTSAHALTDARDRQTGVGQTGGVAMGAHGSESFFVLGEGLLGESAGGRPRTLAPDVEAVTPPFRFSRLGPKGTGRQLSEAIRKKLGGLMAAGTGGVGQIPAGFTYL